MMEKYDKDYFLNHTALIIRCNFPVLMHIIGNNHFIVLKCGHVCYRYNDMCCDCEQEFGEPEKCRVCRMR